MAATGMVPRPALIDVIVDAKPKIGLPRVRAFLSKAEYERHVIALPPAQRDAWLGWIRKRRDKWNRPLTAPALFRSQGDRVIPNEHTTKDQQNAAMYIARALRIQLLEPPPVEVAGNRSTVPPRQ